MRCGGTCRTAGCSAAWRSCVRRRCATRTPPPTPTLASPSGQDSWQRGEFQCPHKQPVIPHPSPFESHRLCLSRLRLAESASEETFQIHLAFPTSSTAVRYIAGAKGCSGLWGLPSVLHCVDPQQIERFRWLIEDVTPPLASLSCSSPYSIQVLAALTGPCVFMGTLFPCPPSLDLLQIYVIAGPDPERARTLYAQCVRRDVIRMSQQGRHRLLRILVPTNNKGENKSFSKEEVSSRGPEFEGAVLSSLDDRLPVRAECVWRVDPQGTWHQGGSKLYTLTAIQTAGRHEEERVLDFSESPLTHLASSVFPCQAQAEAYARIFLPREPPSPDPSSGGAAEAGILAPVRDVLLRKLDALQLPRDALPAAHLCILLLLLPPPDTAGEARAQGHEAVAQLYRFLRGGAGRLWAVQEHALTLCRVLESQAGKAGDVQLCGALAQTLRGLMEGFLTQVGRVSFSSDALFLTENLSSRLQSVCDRLALGPSPAALEELREWCGYSCVLQCQLLSNSLPWVLVLSELKQTADRAAGPQPGNGRPQSPPESVERCSVYTQELLYHAERRADLSRGGGAADMGGLELQAQLSQYLIDCAVDQCWQRCLWTVLSSSPPPANPYPAVVEEFRRAALRLALWRSSDAQLLKQVLPGSSHPSDGGLWLHCGPGGEGHGLESAMRAADPVQLPATLRRALPLRCQDRPTAGSFQVATGLAVLSPATWLGSLSPFLRSLEAVEFCYITAPPDRLPEVLQAYAKLVVSQLAALRRGGALTAYTVHLGRGEAWGERRIAEFPSAFSERLIEDLQEGRPVCLKAFQPPGPSEWRFLPLVKRFVLYYLQQGGAGWLCFPRHDPLTVHRAVFLSREQAAFHLRCVGPAGDPFSCANLQEVMSALDPQITGCFLRGEWQPMYRLLALRALITAEDALLPACWRMAHSAGAQLEYLQSAARTLQELSELSGSGQTLSEHHAAVDVMLRGFIWTLRRTLEHPDSLAPPALWEVVRPGPGLVCGGGGPAWLRAAAAVCGALSDSLARDLHSLCPAVRALLDRLLDAQSRRAVRAQEHSPRAARPGTLPPPPPAPPGPAHRSPAHRTPAQALDSY
ncbi:uncharacterized protein LOC136752557 isoform X2 [Amia ocellicauda]|uniref:uncharacterized protein LOC136752557 isoform X2 n=1 Tax=Amia ocellicauda TaxID=2972642 RepID=UPI003464A205